MADFNVFNHLNNMGFGQGKQAQAQDPTNEKDTIQAIIDEAGKPLYTGAKLTGLHVNITDVGQVGINKQFESEGLTGKMIMQSIAPDAQGGFLAKLLHAIFIKNREITDHTGGTGGGGEGGAFGSGGGGAAGGGDFGGDMAGGGGFSDFNTMNFGSFVSPPDYPSYSYSAISMADLGTFSPPAVGTGQSMGLELG